MGDRLVCSGFPWLPEGETAIFGKGSLTAKILCERHNNALSPLDTTADRFFRELKHIQEQLHQKRWSKKVRLRVVRGENLELWALKVLMGIFHGGIARSGGDILKARFHLPLTRYCALLSGKETLSPPLGIYMRSTLGHRFRLQNSIDMAPLTSVPGNEVVGLQMEIAGVGVGFVFDHGRMDLLDPEPAYTYRPTDLNFVSDEPVDERLFILKMAWASAEAKSITFSQERSRA